MAEPANFGWREGFARLGSYRTPNGGLGWIYAKEGWRENAAAGTLWAWILAEPVYTPVTMLTGYEPSIVESFPYRAHANAGEGRAFPSIESSALIAAGVAVAQ